MKINSNLVLLLLILIGVTVALFPVPEGVDPKALPLLGIFIAVIMGILLQPYPMLVVSLLGFFACILFRLISATEGYAGFGQSVIWLIVFSSIAAKAFVKTNLGRRMALFFIKSMGHSSLTLAYGLTLSEFVLSPMIPSNTARASCITIPLTVSVSESLGSFPGNRSAGIIGRFLALVGVHANQLCSAIFLTAMASNPITQNFMADLGISISWIEWFIMASVPGIVCVFAMPLILYKLAPPSLKIIEHSTEFALLRTPMARDEYVTLLVFLCMLVCWIFGDVLHVSTSVVALGGLCALLVTRVLDADDITGAKDIWSICIWLSILNVIALKLTEFGLIQHYSSVLRENLHGVAWPTALCIVSLAYYFARYLIPGNVLHACAMFPSFTKLLIDCGVPPKVGGMTLALITAYCGFATPYGSSSCPLFVNTGYVDQQHWWRIGFITTLIYLIIWGGIGGIWWKILAYW